MIVLTDKQKEIAAILIRCAQEGKLITFGEIEERTGINRHRVGGEAGTVSKRCLELGLPKLSVLVVYKKSKITGDGYFREFYSTITNKAQQGKIFDNDCNQVFAQKNWNKLIQEIYDIPLKAVDDISVIEGEIKERNGGHYYTRSGILKDECLRQKGAKCVICGFDAEKVYGKQFAGKIHIHHKCPIGSGTTRFTTVAELEPVCPNCHMILHSKGNGGVHTIEEVKDFLQTALNSSVSEE